MPSGPLPMVPHASRSTRTETVREDRMGMRFAHLAGPTASARSLRQGGITPRGPGEAQPLSAAHPTGVAQGRQGARRQILQAPYLSSCKMHFDTESDLLSGSSAKPCRRPCKSDAEVGRTWRDTPLDPPSGPNSRRAEHSGGATERGRARWRAGDFPIPRHIQRVCEKVAGIAKKSLDGA